MKKKIFILLLFIIIILTSCELFQHPSDLYFWTLDEEYNKELDENEKIPLQIYSTDNLKFIMTLGEDDDENPGYSTEEEARVKSSNITFSLTGSDGIEFDNSSFPITVKDLSDSDTAPDWHIYQEFKVNNLTKGITYTITGTTDDLNDEADVTGIIKVIFK